LSPVQSAYIAGLVDGEGTITLRKANYNKNTGFYITPALLITIGSEKVCKTVKRWIGFGSIHERFYPDKPLWNTIYVFQVHAERARNLIRQIKRFLILKNKQASLVLRFPINRTRKPNPNLRRRQLLYLSRIRAMNSRGNKDPALMRNPKIHGYPASSASASS
jgi:hypothetical protein